MMVSATQLSAYSYCPRKLFIRDVLLVEEAPKKELVKGKIWHEAHDMLNKQEESIVSSITTADYQDIYMIYKKNYSKILRNAIIKHKSGLKEFDINMLDLFKEYWSHMAEEAKERSLRVSEFVKSKKVFGKSLWTILTPKIISEQFFKSEKLGLSGVIDVIEIYDNKYYVPVELKTGRVPDKGIWEGHKLQLGAYLLLLRDAGKDSTEAVLKYAGSEGRPLVMNTFLEKEILGIISKTKSVLESLKPPPYVDNRNKCKSCQFKETCYDTDKMNFLLEDLRKSRHKS